MKQKRGLAVTDLFAKPVAGASNRVKPGVFSQPGTGDIIFADFNVISNSAAGKIGAGFKSAAHIGYLPGSAEQQMALWLPSLDAGLPVFG